MGRDTSKVEEETNGLPEKEVVTQIITENQLINMKLDKIVELLTKEEVVEEILEVPVPEQEE